MLRARARWLGLFLPVTLSACAVSNATTPPEEVGAAPDVVLRAATVVLHAYSIPTDGRSEHPAQRAVTSRLFDPWWIWEPEEVPYRVRCEGDPEHRDAGPMQLRVRLTVSELAGTVADRRPAPLPRRGSTVAQLESQGSRLHDRRTCTLSPEFAGELMAAIVERAGGPARVEVAGQGPG